MRRLKHPHADEATGGEAEPDPESFDLLACGEPVGMHVPDLFGAFLRDRRDTPQHLGVRVKLDFKSEVFVGQGNQFQAVGKHRWTSHRSCLVSL